ncbi:hypothetical protein [Sphingomonas sp. 10B4]|uniref:hypothetical protein n=1 Tax=Sphingomonas sp. 10B4 TaxID=3048575 RepID=UPI002AB44BBD|nr:hypothetical protein [Sphingomonas sp. 10B4]MDY7525499.1 hypothetical protein [Sphingomonas sp. 10B4]MEB0281444.1 hypothetical protein [Sphingomonas sp. 10B4]
MAVKPKAGAPKKRAASGRSGGRPRIVIPPETRDAIARLASVGTPQEVIARIVGFSVDTMFRHCKDELELGLAEANAQIAGTLFTKALAGDATAIIWWEKTRAGMRDGSKDQRTDDEAPRPVTVNIYGADMSKREGEPPAG